MWYRTGTVALTNGNATVTGTGTAFIANASIGEAFLGPDGRAYEITDIPSNTSLTISPAYLGSTASGQSYSILPARGRIADLITETQSLLASFAPVRDGIGAGLFPDGSAATPAFRFSGDQDMGIYRGGSNILGIATAGVGRVFVNGDGNVGIGTASPTNRFNVAYTAADPSLSSSAGAALSLLATTSLRTDFGALTASPFSGWLQVHNGAGAAFPLGINPLGGNVGIGTTSPARPLHVRGNTEIARLETTTVRGSGANYIGFFDPSGSKGFVGYAGSNDTFFILNEMDAALQLGAGGAVRWTIGTTGHFTPAGDNTQNIGSGSNRAATIFAGTGTINTSDEREKHWRGELNAAELRAAKRIIGELGIYQWNDAVAEKGEDGARLHFGVRAQRAFAIMEDEGLDWGRYAWACYDQWEEQTEPVMEEVTVTKTRKVMRPSTLIDPATGQPAMVEVDEAYEETEMQPTGETRVTLEAGDRYGVRPDQLAFWLIAAQAAIQADLEARIVALEGA